MLFMKLPNTLDVNPKSVPLVLVLNQIHSCLAFLGDLSFVCFELHLLDCLCQVKKESSFSLLKRVFSSRLLLPAQCFEGEENKSLMCPGLVRKQAAK